MVKKKRSVPSLRAAPLGDFVSFSELGIQFSAWSYSKLEARKYFGCAFACGIVNVHFRASLNFAGLMCTNDVSSAHVKWSWRLRMVKREAVTLPLVLGAVRQRPLFALLVRIDDADRFNRPISVFRKEHSPDVLFHIETHLNPLRFNGLSHVINVFAEAWGGLPGVASRPVSTNCFAHGKKGGALSKRGGGIEGKPYIWPVRRRFDRIKIGKDNELADFVEIVKKSDSYGGFIMLIDEDGIHSFTYIRPSKKKWVVGTIARIERIFKHYFDSIAK